VPKRSRKSKEPRSMNDVVFDIVQSFTSERQSSGKEPPPKDAAAVAREKLSGRKERKARAAKLSPKKRTGIGKKAAAARWGKKT
jgi:hypothetical protein